MIKSLEEYIQVEAKKLTAVKKYLASIETELETTKNQSYYGNPLNSLRMIKRTTRDWRDWYYFIQRSFNELVYKTTAERSLMDTGITPPLLDDLHGAIKGISLIQNTYKLQPSKVAEGSLKNLDTNQTLSASDCYEIGISLFNGGNYANAQGWLTEARTRLAKELANNQEQQKSKFPILTDDDIMPYLANVTYLNGNAKLSYLLTSEYLERHPDDSKALEFWHMLKQHIQDERSVNFVNDNLYNKKVSYVNNLYQKTCNGEVQPSAKSQRELRCRYEDNEVPFCRIAPFKLEELSLDPYVALYHDAIYDSEIDEIMDATNEQLERSKTGDIKTSAVSEVRTSKQTWLNYENHSFLTNIAQRLTDMTGLSLETAEYLQVANYGIGGHYAPHYDFFENGAEDIFGINGNRILTALFYINNVELGGGTAFPFLKLLVPPKRRSMVMWYNLHESLQMDYRTKHAGCPVLKGSKWICNEWYHSMSQEFYRPCDLEEDADSSIEYKNYS